jgi:hypothetical protein
MMYVENEYYAKHWRVPVNKLETVPSSNLVPSSTASGSYHISFDPYDLSSATTQVSVWNTRVFRTALAALAEPRMMENQTRPVAYLPCCGYYTMPRILATYRVVYYTHRSGVRLPLLCVQNRVTYTHHHNDMYLTLFAGVAVMQ